MHSDRRGVEEKLGRIREEEAIIRIYFTKKSNFNKKSYFLKMTLIFLVLYSSIQYLKRTSVKNEKLQFLINVLKVYNI